MRLNARLRSVMFALLPIGLVLGRLAHDVARQRTSLPACRAPRSSANNFLVMYYQPIVELGGQVGAEALLRWPSNRELAGAAYPGRRGMRADPSLHRVRADLGGQRHGPRFFRLHPGAYMASTLDRSTWPRTRWSSGCAARAPPRRHISPADPLVVEVTEYSFIHPAGANHVINRIRALGVRVAIDDFGTGFSSLSHLNNLVRTT
ncbi:EAL domain-containing protein [Rhodanobacter lindaniclasticus]